MTDDPGWGGGLTPPVPQKASTGVPGRSRGIQTGVGIVVVIAILGAFIALKGGPSTSKKDSHKTATTAARTATTASGAAGGGSSSGGAATIPFLGVQVSAGGNPVLGSNGQQISITDASGNSIPLTGVTVQAVRDSVEVSGKARPTPAAVASLATGDEIWAIGEVQSTKFTEVTDGAILSTFLKNYAVTGHTDDVYLYYYDPTTGDDFNNSPPEVALLQIKGSVTTIDCTATGGC